MNWVPVTLLKNTTIAAADQRMWINLSCVVSIYRIEGAGVTAIIYQSGQRREKLRVKETPEEILP